MSTHREWEWDVYHADGAPALRISASTALVAAGEAKKQLPATDPEVYPHRVGCSCRNILEPCLKAQFEAQFRGTPMGRLCVL